MPDSPTGEIPDGFVVISDYDPPLVVIRVIQTLVAIALGVYARPLLTQTSLTPQIYLILLTTVACTLVFHHGVHAITELFLGYTPRVQIVPPRSIGPPTPVSRIHMAVILLMPLFVLSIALYSVQSLFTEALVLIAAFSVNCMLSVGDVWAIGALTRMPRETEVLMKTTDTNPEEFRTLLLLPKSAPIVEEENVGLEENS